jgi:hypothetical protein
MPKKSRDFPQKIYIQHMESGKKSQKQARGEIKGGRRPTAATQENTSNRKNGQRKSGKNRKNTAHLAERARDTTPGMISTADAPVPATTAAAAASSATTISATASTTSKTRAPVITAVGQQVTTVELMVLDLTRIHPVVLQKRRKN